MQFLLTNHHLINTVTHRPYLTPHSTTLPYPSQHTSTPTPHSTISTLTPHSTTPTSTPHSTTSTLLLDYKHLEKSSRLTLGRNPSSMIYMIIYWLVMSIVTDYLFIYVHYTLIYLIIFT